MHLASRGGVSIVSRPPRALVVDQRSRFPLELCRGLARLGHTVDVFAERDSPVFRSRSCHRALVSPTSFASGDRRDFRERLDGVVSAGGYDAIYMCSEQILEIAVPLLDGPGWRALACPRGAALDVVLSKNAVLACVRAAGVAVPAQAIPEEDTDVAALGRELGFPLVIKGDKGELARNVRFADTEAELLPSYREVRAAERGYGGRPALQEFLPGATYLVGGLFRDGHALRLSVHRKAVMYPPHGGATAVAVTERPPALVDAALAAFAALRYTGLGSLDFVHDSRDGSFKFLEINPRVWASIGLARHAGVDLYTPYRALARGERVVPDLRFREGVRYHRLAAELRTLRATRRGALRFVRNCIDPRVASDFELGDLRPHLPLRSAA
jgi:hypothetical protein